MSELDFSKAQPVNPAPPPTSGPALDFSKAQPLSGPTATPPPPPTQQASGLGAWADRTFEGSEDPNPQWRDQGAGGLLSGAVKSAGGLVGNILDFFAKPHPIGDSTPEQQTPLQQKTHEHLQDAATWLKSGATPEGFWENVGAAGEQALEYIGTSGLLELVGAGARTAQAGKAAVTATENLKGAQEVATTLSKNPRLAGLVAIGLKASKDATMLAGQNYAHTEDPTQAAIAGVLGGGIRVGAEGAGAAGRWVQKVMPRKINIEGVDIPVLSTQLNENGKAIDTGAGAAPKIAEAQQGAAPQVIQNVAQNATRASLEQINKTRPVYNAIEDTTRLLPGGNQFKFTLGPGVEPVEGVTGDLLHPAEKFDPLASRVPEGGEAGAQNKSEMGSTASTIPDRLQKRTQAFTSSTEGVEPRTDRVSEAGGGPIQTTDPAQAESWLRRLEEIQQSPIHDSLTPRQQTAIETQRQQLTEELGMYHASPYGQRFAPLDVDGQVGQVRDLGDAADQIQAAAKPVYNQLDRASGGEFDKWNKAAKQSLKIMRSATSVEAYESAEQRYHEATSNINDLITRHAGDVSREDYQTAKLAWRDSARLNELHSVFERMMNGITSEENDQGLTRTMTGRTKALQTYLDKGANREQIAHLIGEDGVTNLKQLTQLMAKPTSTRATADVLKNVVTEIGRHARVGGIGGAIGGAIAHAMNIPWYEGMMTGAVIGEGMRSVMRSAMVNPKLGNLVEYAVRNGVSPKIYAPLIARALTVPLQEQAPPEEENQQ